MEKAAKQKGSHEVSTFLPADQHALSTLFCSAAFLFGFAFIRLQIHVLSYPLISRLHPKFITYCTLAVDEFLHSLPVSLCR